MKKFPLLAGIITLIVIVGGVFLFSKPQNPVPSPEPGVYEYFWGDGCPHCKNVEDFMNSWEKKDKINIRKMEIWYNQDNARVAEDRIKICGIKKENMGVPLLFTPEGKCLSGDGPIIEFFKSL